MLKLVPFNEAWVGHDKLDLKAIYRRPRYARDEYGDEQREFDADGMPTWDLTTGLPIRQHHKWRAKGFEYLTLSDRDSLVSAAANGTLIGGGVRDYAQDPVTRGPWNYRMYAADQGVQAKSESLRMKADVLKYGSEAYEAIRRATDAGFTLPPSLRDIEPTRAATSAEMQIGESPKRALKPKRGRPRKVKAEVAA